MAEAAAESPRLRRFREGFERFAALFNEGDFERASKALADDYAQVFPPGFPQREVEGRGAWVRFFTEMSELVPSWQQEPVEYVEAGPGCFVVGYNTSGIGRASGLPTGATVWAVIQVDRDGLVRRTTEFFDRAQALATAGLTPDNVGVSGREER